ncbi:MAG: cytidylate kinase family protein [Treponema sp.]|nr:cytidylate kinase family protein [Treponema sp.]
MKKNIKIAISGRSGCGNTTVSRLVAEILDLNFINFTFRSLATERNIDLKTILELAKNDESWDREVDTHQVKLARDSDGCVIGSRLAVWLLEEADVKVYLQASAKIRADRIVDRDGGNPDEVRAFTVERDRQDHERYLRIYGIDTKDFDFVDLVIQTENMTPLQIADMVVKKAEQVKENC